MRIRKLAVMAAVVGVAVIGATVPASAGLAADQNGHCDGGEGCFYYNGNRGGSFADYFFAVPNFAGKRFLSPGAGKGQAVKNNSASAWNRWGKPMRVYYNENYSGPYDELAPYGWENLVNTWNDNASFNWRV